MSSVSPKHRNGGSWVRSGFQLQLSPSHCHAILMTAGECTEQYNCLLYQRQSQTFQFDRRLCFRHRRTPCYTYVIARTFINAAPQKKPHSISSLCVSKIPLFKTKRSVIMHHLMCRQFQSLNIFPFLLYGALNKTYWRDVIMRDASLYGIWIRSALVNMPNTSMMWQHWWSAKFWSRCHLKQRYDTQHL